MRLGNAETAVPRLLAMLCILAVFLPSFFMEGAARALFVPLSLAVGFSMVTSYLLSSTFVPVLSVWLLRHYHPRAHSLPVDGSRSPHVQSSLCQAPCAAVLPLRWDPGPRLFASWPGWRSGWWAASLAGRFSPRWMPGSSSSASCSRRHPHRASPSRSPSRPWNLIKEEVGPDNVELSVGYVGLIGSSYPINTIFLWIRGPEEAVLRVALKPGSGVRIEELKQRLREQLPRRLGEWLEGQLRADGLPSEKIAERVAGLRFSFEPADIVNEVMSFRLADADRDRRQRPELRRNSRLRRKGAEPTGTIPSLRDLQFAQSLDYPDVRRARRPRAGRPERRDGRGCEPTRWSRPRRRAASWCRSSGPIRKPASATRCRWRSPRTK